MICLPRLYRIGCNNSFPSKSLGCTGGLPPGIKKMGFTPKSSATCYGLGPGLNWANLSNKSFSTNYAGVATIRSSNGYNNYLTNFFCATTLCC